MSPTFYTVLMGLLLFIPLIYGLWYPLKRVLIQRRKNRAQNFILQSLEIQDIEEAWIIRVIQEDGIGLSVTEIQDLLHELTTAGLILSRGVQGGSPGPWKMYSLPKKTTSSPVSTTKA